MVTAMQATVASWDPETGSGEALLDDGTPLSFPGEAFRASGLRLLRLGQRLRLVYGDDGTVVRLGLVTSN